MNEQSATERLTAELEDTSQTVALRRQMVGTMVLEGAVTDDTLREAFLDVPRHMLLPHYYPPGSDAGVDYVDHRDAWLAGVHSDTALIIKRQDGEPTSACPPPGLLATMLQALDIEDDDRVLQVGTGSGYTVALLCELVGSKNVTSIDIDPELTERAWERLYRCGYGDCTIITDDGTFGDPRNAPYDRCLVTYGVPRVPLAWVEQTRAGGVIVVPIGSWLARLTATCSRAEGLICDRAEGRFIGPGSFLRGRERGAGALLPELLRQVREGAADLPLSLVRTSELPSSVFDDIDFQFVLGMTHPDLGTGFRDGDRLNLLVYEPDGSHAHVTAERRVREWGPRRLWEEIECLYEEWRSVGAPPPERFGLTVTPREQFVWLDEPAGRIHWTL